MKRLDSTLIRNSKGEMILLKSHNKEYVGLLNPEFFENNPEIKDIEKRKKIQRDAIIHTENHLGNGPYEVLEIFEYVNTRSGNSYDLLTLIGRDDLTMQLDKRFFYKIDSNTI